MALAVILVVVPGGFFLFWWAFNIISPLFGGPILGFWQALAGYSLLGIVGSAFNSISGKS
ncbi:MAG: hypothetical protein ACRC62_34010 [Microcoleus sp.]